MDALITLLPGDGIGPEVCAGGREALVAVGQVFGHRFEFSEQLIGGAAIDEVGAALPPDTAASCRESQAVLLGAVGGPKWSDPNAPIRPESGLLELRAQLEVFANLRPVKPFKELFSASPLKESRLDGVDIMVVRELTGGIYFGDKERSASKASDVCVYHDFEVKRILRTAAKLAATREGKLVSVDKANILETSRLWRDVSSVLMAEEFPTVAFEHLLVDAAAMHLINRPADFDVIVTENMFGDILTDEASMLSGSMGMLPSASLGDGGTGLYEPIHGSAPDIAGKGIANPCGMIGSVALLLRHSLQLDEEADRVEAAVQRVIADGYRTADIAGPADGPCSTAEMTAAIVAAIR